MRINGWQLYADCRQAHISAFLFKDNLLFPRLQNAFSFTTVCCQGNCPGGPKLMNRVYAIIIIIMIEHTLWKWETWVAPDNTHLPNKTNILPSIHLGIDSTVAGVCTSAKGTVPPCEHFSIYTKLNSSPSLQRLSRLASHVCIDAFWRLLTSQSGDLPTAIGQFHWLSHRHPFWLFVYLGAPWRWESITVKQREHLYSDFVVSCFVFSVVRNNKLNYVQASSCVIVNWKR